ncbi:MFS transporter [Iodobacter sp. LRB]|uniref:MFS transporter n=1 Tax=unclassified Iodobacter TaxID=235634 RepID=UPI000C0F8DC8|nr:MFS transporter [Iodobacter sp. BJB302]PHV00834.1 MFS transporter [Iodobacter sp. BJB302]
MLKSLNPERRTQAMLLVLMLVMFTSIADFMILMPLAPDLMREMHIDTARFGFLVSAYSLAAGVASLLAASLADRFDRRQALLVCYAGLVLATMACSAATGFYSLLAARGLAGIFGGVIGSIIFAIVGDLIPPERRGWAMSWVMLGFSLSAVAGVPLGLFIAAHSNWRMPFVALSAMCVLVWIGVWYLLPAVKGHLTKAPQGLLAGYKELFADINHWWACGVTAMLTLSGFCVIPYIASTMVSNSGLTTHELVYMYLLGGVATLFSRPFIGGLIDRYSPTRILGYLVIASFVPLILVTQTFALALAWQLLFSTLFFVFVSGRFIPATAMVTGATAPQMRGRLMAFNSATQNFASGVAALLAGTIMTQSSSGRIINFDWVGYLSCVFGLLAIWMARRVKAVS